MTTRGLGGLVRSAPFVACLAAAAVATGLEAGGQALLLPADARVRARGTGVSRVEALEREDAAVLESASERLPFDAAPRRWAARVLARAPGTPGDARLERALREGLDRRPRDPVLLFLEGERALGRGDETESDRLRFAALRLGAHEGWIVDRFARERFAAGRAREAAAAEGFERAARLAESGDAPGAAALREEAVRERDGARRALETVVRIPEALSPELRRRSDVDVVAAEAAKDLADLARAP